MSNTLKSYKYRKVVSAIVILAMVLSFVCAPVLIGQDASSRHQVYAEEDGAGASSTFRIVVIEKDGSQEIIETYYLAEEGDRYVTSPQGISVMSNITDFDTYKKYGALVYSGQNRVDARMGIVKSGITLDDIKKTVKEKKKYNLSNDCYIGIKTTDLLNPTDISELDDDVRYCYLSYIRAGVPYGEDFDEETRSIVPIIFALDNNVVRDLPTQSKDDAGDTAVNAMINEEIANTTTATALRLIVGQRQGDGIEETLGSMSLYNINEIRLSKYFEIKTTKGLSVNTDDGYVRASPGENVTFSMNNRNHTVFEAKVVDASDVEIPVSYNVSTGKFSFIMPASKVTISAEPWRARIKLDPNGGSVSLTSLTAEQGGTYGTIPDATRSGYIFVGWFTSKTGGSMVTSSSKVPAASQQTLYAQWLAKPLSVTSAPAFKQFKAATKLTAKNTSVKKTASASSKTIKKLKAGTAVTVTGEKGKYYLVKYSGSKKGYILKTQLYKYKSAKMKSKAKIIKSASSKAKTVKTVSKGSKLTVIGKKGKYYKVKSGPKTGYVQTKYVKLS